MHRNSGTTLLELLLVVMVVVVIFMGGLQFTRYHRNEIFVEQQKEGLAMTFLLLNQYYLNNCRAPDLNAKTLADLKTWGALAPAMFTSQELAMIPSNFSIQFVGQQILLPNPHMLYTFVVSANYAGLNTSQVQQLAGELGADNTVTPLTWTRLPRQSSTKETTSNSLWIASMNLQSKLGKTDSTYTGFCPE